MDKLIHDHMTGAECAACRDYGHAHELLDILCDAITHPYGYRATAQVELIVKRMHEWDIEEASTALDCLHVWLAVLKSPRVDVVGRARNKFRNEVIGNAIEGK